MQMNRWIIPGLVFVATAFGAWHFTLLVTTYGIMETAVRRLSAQGGLNTMAYGNLATPKKQPIVRPSPDLAYSSCPFDLSAGPLSIAVTPVPGRYSSLSVFDARTDAVFVRNDVQAKRKPYRIVLARVGQLAPAGAEIVRVRHDRGIALIRLLLNDPSELGALDAVRRQSHCEAIGGA
jgi:uncharacterized membrane protein